MRCKSYIVRWVNVQSGHTISWSVQPHKKSINFGIFKRPSESGVPDPSLIPSSTSEITLEQSSDSRNASSTAIEKLKGTGLVPIRWHGKCDADKVSLGTYDVGPLGEGNYALVLDNTFSKTVSKTVTLVLLTYPTHAPPQSAHQVHHSKATEATAAPTGLNNRPLAKSSTDSLSQTTRRNRSHSALSRPPRSAGSLASLPSTIHTGVLQKRRRKRGQGYARRFFSLDFTSCTLSYYHDRNSSALRGAIPLSLAAVAANEQTREISVDSGAEIWHLKANNANDFQAWRSAIERAAQGKKEASTPRASHGLRVATQTIKKPLNPAEETEWAKIETLVGRLAGSRDAVRRLAKDTDPKYLPTQSGSYFPTTPSASSSPVEVQGEEDYFDTNPNPKKSFWKRKPSSAGATPAAAASFRRSVSTQLAVPSPAADTMLSNNKIRRTSEATPKDNENMHEYCLALLRDLDTVVAEFSSLIDESKQRRHPLPDLVTSMSRASFESDSQEFFDAPDGGAGEDPMSPILCMQRDSTEGSREAIGEAESTAYNSGSDVDEDEDYTHVGLPRRDTSPLFPTKPKSLVPLPLSAVSRRTSVPPPLIMPPSLIGFLRKNVGKDLSTISMPVSANEPTSLLQRCAEQLEYSTLLDQAASSEDPIDRLLHVTAFAISSLSNARIKERSIRKPFNPMLGETFELVREDRGFRFIAEKVSHRPVQLAFQADAASWSFSQSPTPSQKFWGKSSEIMTDGKCRLALHAIGEHYSWSSATCFLKNIIAGEKYVEPDGTMTITNETTGDKAIITFKAGGMFSGRSEDVTATMHSGSDGITISTGLIGKWTTALYLTENAKQTDNTIWSAGPLVDNPQKHYGLPLFAASLNEMTDIEKGHVPPTDSRLRPDQRLLEQGQVEEAEDMKARLEEKQRERRKEMEGKGENWTPKWFTRVESEGVEEVVWRLKGGKEGYWEERGRGDWGGVVDVFKLDA